MRKGILGIWLLIKFDVCVGQGFLLFNDDYFLAKEKPKFNQRIKVLVPQAFPRGNGFSDALGSPRTKDIRHLNAGGFGTVTSIGSRTPAGIQSP